MHKSPRGRTLRLRFRMNVVAVRAAWVSVAVLFSACDLAPEMKLPEFALPEMFKESPAVEPVDAAMIDGVNWKRVDTKITRAETAWWRVLNLPELDGLMEQAMKESPTIDVALARVNAALGLAEISGAALMPSVDVGAGPQRQRQSQGLINANSPPGFVLPAKPFTSYTVQGSISYMFDLFGKNRNTAKAAQLSAEAEESNYYAARLGLQAEIARAYVDRASLLAEKNVLTRTLSTRQEVLAHVKRKHLVGAVDDLVLAAAEREVAEADTQRASVAQAMSQAEHRLATLIGVVPANLKLNDYVLTAPPPQVPAGMPSLLLTRRPDIDAAIKSIAVANARVGAARAGYFPDISLSVSGGFGALSLSDIFKKPNQFWSLGPMAGGTVLTQPLFRGGEIEGTLAARKAEYDQASASYKSAVLTALREVEDGLSNQRELNAQAASVSKGLTAAKRAYAVAGERYKVGYSSQLEYLDAERNLLGAERTHIQTLGQRYVATIQLIAALGGGW